MHQRMPIPAEEQVDRKVGLPLAAGSHKRASMTYRFHKHSTFAIISAEHGRAANGNRYSLPHAT